MTVLDREGSKNGNRYLLLIKFFLEGFAHMAYNELAGIFEKGMSDRNRTLVIHPIRK
jgi:hypothetical protein